MNKSIQRLKRFFSRTPYKLKEQLRYEMRYNWLMDKTLNSIERGIISNKICEYEIVVSLTSFGKRIYDVSATVESVMQGSLKPNRIVLWLSDDMKVITLPIALQKQKERGLEINFCKDIRSYKKLIPALYKYPESAIITLDDDVIYEWDLVEKLVNMHIAYPKHIIANRIHRILLSKGGRPASYMKWDGSANPTDDSPLNFFTGCGGVLYPPHSLAEEVFNESVFLDICKFADDVWFNAMALKNGTRVLKCYTHDKEGQDYCLNQNVQDVALMNLNAGRHCANDVQLQAVFDRYNLWNKLSESCNIHNVGF